VGGRWTGDRKKDDECVGNIRVVVGGVLCGF
jgi:hypothetical protein